MVRNKNPPIAWGTSLRQELGEAIQKVLAILIVPKYLPALDPPDHEMMEYAGGVESG
jgi:hypothetical protein